MQTMSIKITICRILRNISLELATAETLCEREELDDVITSLLINADYATELFYEVVQFVHALITILQARGGGGHNENLNKLMKNLNERNLFDKYHNNSTPLHWRAFINSNTHSTRTPFRNMRGAIERGVLLLRWISQVQHSGGCSRNGL